EISREIVFPPSLRGTITRLLTKNRRNHHRTPAYASASRFTLTPPAVLPIAPPIKTIIVSTARGTAGQYWMSEFCSPQVQIPEIAVNVPCLNADSRVIFPNRYRSQEIISDPRNAIRRRILTDGSRNMSRTLPL